MDETVLIFGTNLNKSKFYSVRNQEQIEVRKRLLSFSEESFSSSLISKNITIKIHRTGILPFVLYGCETWSLTLTEGV